MLKNDCIHYFIPNLFHRAPHESSFIMFFPLICSPFRHLKCSMKKLYIWKLLYLLTSSSRQHSLKGIAIIHIDIAINIYRVCAYFHICLYTHMLAHGEELSYDLVLTVFWTRFFPPLHVSFLFFFFLSPAILFLLYTFCCLYFFLLSNKVTYGLLRCKSIQEENIDILE